LSREQRLVARTGEQARAEQRRERIMEAALDVFARRGYREAAMDEIAVESDTSKGGLYFHFPNKQTLFLSLLDRLAGLLVGRVEAAVAAESDPLRRIERALGVVLETFGSHRRLARLFLVEALGSSPEVNARMLALHRRFAQLIASELAGAANAGEIPPLDAELAGKVWFGALNEVVTDWLLADDGTALAERAAPLRAILMRSIGAPDEEPGS
jgi:AcrR family transcriptional regulator